MREKAVPLLEELSRSRGLDCGLSGLGDERLDPADLITWSQ